MLMRRTRRGLAVGQRMGRALRRAWIRGLRDGDEPLKEGVEIHLEPKMAGMSPEQVREFCRRVMALADELSGGNDEN